MPKERKRTTTRGSYSEAQLTAAVNAVESGTSIRAAAREFGIAESTIRLRRKTGNTQAAVLGRKPAFTVEQEEELAAYVIKVANLFYGLTPIELRRIAYDYAEANKIIHGFNQETRTAGKDWLAGFLKRNNSISLRKPEGTSLNRINAFNETSVGNFFSNLQTVLDKHKFGQDRIYNVDETGISNVQKPVKILGPKGQKQVGSVISCERGKNVTVICAVSAMGNFVPPMFIYPRLRMSPHLKKGGPPGSVHSCSKNGWSNEGLFYDWIQHFKTFVRPTMEDPVLLIMDNHNSHISVRIYDFCRENGIVILTIPPHTSHRLQPLDLTVYGPLKSAFYRECYLSLQNKSRDRNITELKDKKISQFELAELFSNAYLRTATMQNGVAGFKAAGISPFNPEKFNLIEVSDQQFGEFGQIPIEIAGEEYEKKNKENTEQGQQQNEGQYEREENTSELPETSCEEPAPGTSKGVASESHNSENRAASTTQVRVTDISPLPISRLSHSNGKKSKSQGSEILTSTPVKEKLELAERKREEKKKRGENKTKKRTVAYSKPNNKKNKKACRRQLILSESETEEEEIDENTLCDDNDDEDVEFNADVCIVCNEFGRDGEMWFRCVTCGLWAHADCSGWDTAKNYMCDYCLRKEKRNNN